MSVVLSDGSSPDILGPTQQSSGPDPASDRGVAILRQTASKLPPLFLLHMSGGDLDCYARLTAALGENRTIFGLVAPTRRPLPLSIEQIAEHHAAAIKCVQPDGPYLLIGYCFGGLLAYEVARQLSAAGAKVDLVAIIDFPLNIVGQPIRFRWGPASIAKFIRNLGSWANDIGSMSRQRQWQFFAEKFQSARMHLRHLLDRTSPLPRDKTDTCPPDVVDPEVWHSHEKAWRAYRPGPYPGKVLIMRRKSLPILHACDTAFGWNQLADVDVHLIPGPQHNDVLRPPYVQIFAEQLRTIIDAS